MTFRTALIVGALLTVPAIALAQKVSYDYDKSAPFSQFKTYVLKSRCARRVAVDRRAHS
jgi:hypothetical protein